MHTQPFYILIVSRQSEPAFKSSFDFASTRQAWSFSSSARRPTGQEILCTLRVPRRSGCLAQAFNFARRFNDRPPVPDAEEPQNFPPALHECAVRKEGHYEGIRENVLGNTVEPAEESDAAEHKRNREQQPRGLRRTDCRNPVTVPAPWPDSATGFANSLAVWPGEKTQSQILLHRVRIPHRVRTAPSHTKRLPRLPPAPPRHGCGAPASTATHASPHAPPELLPIDKFCRSRVDFRKPAQNLRFP